MRQSLPLTLCLLIVDFLTPLPAYADAQLGRFVGTIDALPEVHFVAFIDERTAFALHAGDPPVAKLIFDDANSLPRMEPLTLEAARDAGAPVDLWNAAITPEHPYWVDPPPDGLLTPIALTRDAAGNTLLLDRHANRLHRFDRNAGAWHGVGDWGAFPGLFAHPGDVEAAAGRIYVVDTRNHRIQIFDDRLSYVGEWGLHVLRPHEDGGHLHYPEGIAVSGDGMIAIVTEPVQDRLQIFGLVSADEEASTAQPMFERETIAHFGPHAAREGQLLITTEPDRPGLVVWDLTRSLPIMIGQIVGQGEAFGLFRSVGEVALQLDGPGGQPRVWSLDPVLQRLQVFELSWSPEKVLGFDPFLARFVRAFDLRSLLGRDDARVSGFLVRSDGSLLLHDATDGSIVLTDSRFRAIRRQENVHAPGSRVRLQRGPDEGTVALIHADTGLLELISLEGESHRERFVIRDVDPQANQHSPIEVVEHPLELSGLLFTQGSTEREFWVVNRRSHRVLRGTLGSVDRIAESGDGAIPVIVPEFVLGTVDGAVPPHPRDRMAAGLFHKPSGLLVDNFGHLIVIDEGNHRVQFFGADGRFLDTYGALWYTQLARRAAPGRINR